MADVPTYSFQDRLVVGLPVMDVQALIDNAVTAAVGTGGWSTDRTFSINTTITDPVSVTGGIATVANGVTLTINAPFSAPPIQVFNLVGNAQVVFGPGSCEYALCEWFGGAADGVRDSGPAINAAIRSHNCTQLLGGTYLSSVTINIAQSERALAGLGWTLTTLMVTSGFLDVISVGGQSATVVDAKVTKLRTGRTVGPVLPASPAADATGACGVRATNIIRLILDEINDAESVTGFYFHNVTNLFGTNLNCNRTADSSTRWTGFWLDGDSESAGVSGNNSSRLTNCIAGSNLLGTTTGVKVNGHVSDTFLSSVETALTTQGIVIDGESLSDRAMIDVHLTTCICDNTLNGAIVVKNISPYGVVSINGGYGALNQSATGAAVQITNATGVSVGGGFQAIGWPCSSGVGIAVSNSRGVTVDRSVRIQDCFRPVSVNGFYSSTMSPTILNTDTRSSAQSAIAVSATSRSTFAPQIDSAAGTAGTFNVGVDVTDAGTGTAVSEVNGTGINAGPVTTKIRSNGTAVTTAGTFGTNNLASGIVT